MPAAAVVDEKSRTEAKPVATVDQPSTLPAFLEPTSNPLCPASFPRGYVFVGKTESETQALFRVIWRDGQSRGDYVVAVSPDTPDAEAARCIAIGPHRDLNIGNWCCR